MTKQRGLPGIRDDRTNGANDEISDGQRDWFTAGELADFGLPGLPADKRQINRRAREERWHLRLGGDGSHLARPRAGRGGGVEFHVSLLPGPSRLALAQLGLCVERPSPAEAESPSAAAWRWYDGRSAKVKAEAERRMAIVREIVVLEESGMTRSAALSEASRRHQTGKSTLWSWLGLIDGVARSDWLPALAPRRQGGGREAEIDGYIWQIFVSDYLRPSAPTLASCFDRTAEIAAERGLPMPSQVTLRRKLQREIDPGVILLRRGGEEDLRRSLPSQRRSIEELHALECVNIDGHKFDVFVKTADGRVIRPIMVAIQDLYSSKVLAWRLGETESAVQTRLAFADLFRGFGIPKGCVLDNGRAFASKWITGGATSRFRFKIREEEPTGLLTALGVAIHWALPYRGQSKPIERAFRDMCDRIARHPAMEGAYCGNKPDAKPDNYGSRAIDWDEFVAHVDRGIALHNAKLGRRGRNYKGRSFDEVFAESYASAQIGKASPEQMRMALLAAEQVRVNRRTGEIALFGNRYWSHACLQLCGQLVAVRFDPDDLTQDVHLYASDGRYLTSAQIMGDIQFFDAAGAKDSAKLLADYRKRTRAGAEAYELLEAAEVARQQAQAPVATPLPEPAVIQPMRHRGQTAAALKHVEPAPQPAEPSKILSLFTSLKREE